MQSVSDHSRFRHLLAWCKQMREHSPVFYEEQTQLWNLFRYEDVVRCLSDPTTFSNQTSQDNPESGGGMGGNRRKGDILQPEAKKCSQKCSLTRTHFCFVWMVRTVTDAEKENG